MVPVELRRQMETFRTRLLQERSVTIEHDLDVDGLVAGHLLLRALERAGRSAEPIPTLREYVFRPKGTLVLADLALHAPVTRALGGRTYAIDHHRWAEGVEKQLVAYVNPHFAGVDQPEKWNTGYLVFLTFQGLLSGLSWLAAVSIVADSAGGEHNSWLLGQFEEEELKRASMYLNAALHLPKTKERIHQLLRSCQRLEDVFENETLAWAFETFQSILRDYLENPSEHAVVWDPSRHIMFVHVNAPVEAIKATVASALSQKYPDWLVFVSERAGNKLFISLRHQRARKIGLDLGLVAREAARRLGGYGGGHPPAAGMTVPTTEPLLVYKTVMEVMGYGR